MTLNEAIELTEIRKKMVQAQCEDCWSEDAEIGLKCMYIVKGLIRCKDCKWYSANAGYHWGRCENYRPYPFDETDYCSRAERKEE